VSTRIRYVKQPDGSLESMQVFKKNLAPDEFKCVISADGKKGKVIDARTRETQKQVSGTSAHKTKIALKDALRVLGVPFLNERREKPDGDDGQA
jgi:hypothetical protein